MLQALGCRPCAVSGETGEAQLTITRIILTVLLAVALWACATIFARADVRILESPGGQVGPFLDLFDRVKASGERVIECIGGLRPEHDDLAHVREVEQSGSRAHRVVLGEVARVPHRHLPAGEVREARACGDVRIVQGR